jgi:transcriptional regulator with GAF, ATPase, and Fis domain
VGNVWIRFLGGESALAKNMLYQALGNAGLTVQDFAHGKVKGPGILFFEKNTLPPLNQLRELSRNGLERIVAVAADRSALNSRAAWALLHAGASDVFAWDSLADPAAEIRARIERWNAVDQLVDSATVQDNLVGRSPAWISVLRQIVEVARFSDASALITGETGTGKDLVARLIHTLDRRPSKQDLVILDCTTVVPELSGSEFFGHERGAFTGAIAARDGAFALANGGTLFLDEVGDLPLPLQAQLLRVVQEGSYKRVGGNSWHETKFRLICATNKSFDGELAQGRFRHDFYYRIASWTCRLPSLRERSEDILPLARHFMRQASRAGKSPEMDELVCEYLLKREYPGNVRDLRRLILRIMNHHVGDGPITLGDIPEDERSAVEPELTDWRDEHFESSIKRALLRGTALKEIGRAAEDAAIKCALENEGGSLRQAAKKLEVTERALQIRRAARRKSTWREL